MFARILLLLAGIVLIIKGGDLFVSASIRTAEFLNVPRIVVGTTLVSLATTSPEMVVSIVAGLEGESALALGNAVGSCICNIGLILGLTAIVKHIDVHPRLLRNSLLAMFFAAVVLFAFTLDLGLGRLQGALLLILGTGYFIYDLVDNLRKPRHAREPEVRAIEKELGAFRKWLQTKRGTAIQFIVGAAIVVLGSKLMVDSAVFIASAMGIHPIIVGLTVVAVGTSLPELITAITSSRQNVSDLAVGNIVGANIANLTLIVGIAAVLSGVTMTRSTQLYNFPALLIIMLFLLYVVLSAKRITRTEGFVLLALYGIYIAGLVGISVLSETM